MSVPYPSLSKISESDIIDLMIDHFTFRVSNIEATARFYSAALSPLGYSMSFDQTFDDHVRVIGFGKDGKTNTFFAAEAPTSGPAHIAYKAQSRREVDEFHKLALDAGGKDNGAPGMRPEYHENYYGAFVFDPDGNNIEVVFGN